MSKYEMPNLPDGSKYSGQWKDGHLNGKGIWTHPNGVIHVGLPFDFLFFLAFNTIIETFQLMIDQYQGVRHT